MTSTRLFFGWHPRDLRHSPQIVMGILTSEVPLRWDHLPAWLYEEAQGTVLAVFVDAGHLAVAAKVPVDADYATFYWMCEPYDTEQGDLYVMDVGLTRRPSSKMCRVRQWYNLDVG